MTREKEKGIVTRKAIVIRKEYCDENGTGRRRTSGTWGGRILILELLIQPGAKICSPGKKILQTLNNWHCRG
jgi:hypothetical protein